MDKKKVVIIEIAGKGGICHYSYNLANALGSDRKVVLVTGKNYELKNRKRNFVVVEMFNRLRTNLFFIFDFLKIIKEKNTTICHFQLSQYPSFILFLLWLAKLSSKTKVVITAHNVTSHEKKNWEIVIYKTIYCLADRIVVHAEANKQELLESFPLDKAKINVIPHGNYMFFNEDTQSTAECKHESGRMGNAQINTDKGRADGKTILFFGYIREYKGLMHLIRALAKVVKKISKAKLLIVGKPVEDFKKYEVEIDKLHLSSNIELRLDYVPFEEVKDYLSKAVIMALPYEKIYQSGVLQLAYGFGIPVVVTDTGGLPEAVEDGGNGKIVPVGDVEALADAIIEILSDDVLLKRMGKRSLELAKTRFNWETIAEKTILRYRELERS